MNAQLLIKSFIIIFMSFAGNVFSESNTQGKSTPVIQDKIKLFSNDAIQSMKTLMVTLEKKYGYKFVIESDKAPSESVSSNQFSKWAKKKASSVKSDELRLIFTNQLVLLIAGEQIKASGLLNENDATEVIQFLRPYVEVNSFQDAAIEGLNLTDKIMSENRSGKRKSSEQNSTHLRYFLKWLAICLAALLITWFVAGFLKVRTEAKA